MARRNNGEGSISKRKDGRWEGRYYTGEVKNGKRVRKNVLAKTKTECKEKLDKAIAENEKQQQIMNRCNFLTNPEPTLEEWSKVWFESFCIASMKEYTLNSYKGYFKNYILPNLGGMRIKDISTVTCQQF